MDEREEEELEKGRRNWKREEEEELEGRGEVGVGGEAGKKGK